MRVWGISGGKVRGVWDQMFGEFLILSLCLDFGVW